MKTLFYTLCLVFIALSAADYGITYHLLHHCEACYEANPIARAVLCSGGWLGLGAFKASLVAFCVTALSCVHPARPGLAVAAVAFACLVTASAVLCGVTLL